MSILLRFVATIAIVIATLFFWFQGALTQKPEAIITWSTESEVDTAGFGFARIVFRCFHQFSCHASLACLGSNVKIIECH